MNEEFNFANDIVPILQLLCKNDRGKDEVTFTQTVEIIGDLAELLSENPDIANRLIKWGVSRTYK